MMQKLLGSELNEDRHRLISFVYFDVDPPEHQELALQHKITDVPFLAFYRDGCLIHTITGMRDLEVISKWLTDLVSAEPI